MSKFLYMRCSQKFKSDFGVIKNFITHNQFYESTPETSNNFVHTLPMNNSYVYCHCRNSITLLQPLATNASPSLVIASPIHYMRPVSCWLCNPNAEIEGGKLDPTAWTKCHISLKIADNLEHWYNWARKSTELRHGAVSKYEWRSNCSAWWDYGTIEVARKNGQYSAATGYR